MPSQGRHGIIWIFCWWCEPWEAMLGFSTGKLLLSPSVHSEPDSEPESLRPRPHSWERGNFSSTSGRANPQRISEHTYMLKLKEQWINIWGETVWGCATLLFSPSTSTHSFWHFLVGPAWGGSYHGVQVAPDSSSSMWKSFPFSLFIHLFRSVQTQMDVYFILWFSNPILILLILLSKLSHFWPLGALYLTQSMTIRWGTEKELIRNQWKQANNEERREKKMSQLNTISERDFRER